MKQLLIIFLLAVSLNITAFTADNANSVDEAIKASSSMDSAKDKITYLISQANSLYNSKQFEQVVQIAQYILQHIDKNSAPAKSLLAKAKDALMQGAQSALPNVTKGRTSFGK